MRDHEQLVRDLLQRGLDVAHGGKHLKVTDGERTVTVPVSPSEYRGRRNLVAQLRRVGFLDPPEATGAPKRGRRPEATPRPYEGVRAPYGRPWRGRGHG